MSDQVIVFDVNETLLDVRALAPFFESAFGDTALLPNWFGLLLRYSLEVSVTGDYRPFDELAVGALHVTASGAGTAISSREAEAVVDAMAELPAHPDVPAALARLDEAGFRLATLTNSRPDVVRSQLAHAGLAPHFDDLLSVDAVRRFKPHPDTYGYASRALDVPIDGLTLVAAHDWDVNGALLAGAEAVFVERPGATRSPHDRIPDTVATDLAGVADVLIARSKR